VRLKVAIDNVSGESDIPDAATMRRWLKATLGSRLNAAELCVRIVNEAESALFNLRFRNRAGPTNVLSFPADLPANCPIPLLGDLVICAPIIIREALEQRKEAAAHWAHILVHGALHLLGYDHINDDDAGVMEALETEILVAMGFPPPYTAADIPETSLA